MWESILKQEEMKKNNNIRTFYTLVLFYYFEKGCLFDIKSKNKQ